jgi:hypothetical protein
MATTPDNPKKSNISSGIRITIALLVAIILGLFILCWDSRVIDYVALGIPHWVGRFVIMPGMAVVLSFGGNCLMQQLSCSQIQWLLQVQRAAVVPIPLYLMWLVLYFFPIMRWPIEGLVQTSPLPLRTGFSSGFYTFWTALYTQGILNSLAQICT